MPLNQQLYNALRRRFGRVLLQKDGEAMHYRVVKTANGKQQVRVTPARGGEDYKVCCPFCNDNRYRFEVNHRWNSTDPATGVYFGVSFMRCYNNGCDANVDAPFQRRVTCHEELVDMLKAYVARGRGLITKAPTDAGEIKPANLPEKCIPLDALSPGHSALQYLRDRKFDPYTLSRDWRLMFCIDDPNPLVAGRIIIPIYYNDMLVGWQARFVGNPPSDNIPKYYTMPKTPKSRILYNYDRAKHCKFGVLVEGVTDAWRLGDAGVATLGSSLSVAQVQLAKLAWGKHGVVLMYDPDLILAPRKRPNEPTPYERLKERLADPTAFERGVLEMVLPIGTDPGEFETATLWNMITQAAQTKGFLRKEG
jgi:hypothetical protein